MSASAPPVNISAAAPASPTTLTSYPFPTLTPNDLPAIYSSLSKNPVSHHLDLHSFLTFSRSLTLERGGDWNLEDELDRIDQEGYDIVADTGLDEEMFVKCVTKNLAATEESNRVLLGASPEDFDSESIAANVNSSVLASKKRRTTMGILVKTIEEGEKENSTITMSEIKQHLQQHQQQDASTTVAVGGTASTQSTPPSAPQNSQWNDLPAGFDISSLNLTNHSGASVAQPTATTTSTTTSSLQTPFYTPISSPEPPRTSLHRRNGSRIIGTASGDGVQTHEYKATSSASDERKYEELEELYERQHRELEKVKQQLRSHTSLRIEYEQYQKEMEKKEELLNDKLEMLAINLAREKAAKKLLISSYETRVHSLTDTYTSLESSLTTFKRECELLTTENTKLQNDARKLKNSNADLEDTLEEHKKLATALKSSMKNMEKLEKRVHTFDELSRAYQSLQAEHDSLSIETDNLASAYEQLHNAYSSEVHLYREAEMRIQVLERELRAAGGGGGGGVQTNGGTKGQNGSSIHDELLSCEPSRATTPTASPHTAAMIQIHPPDSGYQQHQRQLSANIAQPSSATATAAPSHHTTHSQSSLVSPVLSTLATLPLPPRRRSFAFQTMPSPMAFSPPTGGNGANGAAASSATSATAVRHHPFQPHLTDAELVNWQVFQLIALSVASAVSSDRAATATTTAAKLEFSIPSYYEEAMSQQIHVNRYAQFIEQKLRFVE